MNSNKKPLVICLVFVVCFAALAYAAIRIENAVLSDRDATGQKRATDYLKEKDSVDIDGTLYKMKDNIDLLLLIGIDEFGEQTASFSYNDAAQADFLMLAVFDNAEKKYTLIHINRDTMTPVNVLGINGKKADTLTQQIALAHTYGTDPNISCMNTVDAVSELFFDAKVEKYISMSMDGVALANDIVGGVSVTFSEDLTEIDPRFTEGNTVKLDGALALKYIRSRGGLEDSSNLARMARQRQYIGGFLKTAAEQDDDTFFASAQDSLAKYVVTNCTVNFLSDTYNKLREYTFTGVVYPDGEAKTGDEYIEFYPNMDSLKEIVTDLIYEKTT